MRFMGVDFGERRVGVALSDEGGSVAFPDRVLKNSPALVDEIAAIVEEHAVKTVVIGASLNEKGRDNPVMTTIRRFGERLSENLGVPILYEPESFTSVEARAAGAKETDAAAAAIILNSYLERVRSSL